MCFFQAIPRENISVEQRCTTEWNDFQLYIPQHWQFDIPNNTLTMSWIISLIFPILNIFELHNHSFLMLMFSHMSFSSLFFFHFQWHCTVMILIIEKQTKTFSILSYHIFFPILWEGIILKLWNTFVWIYFDSFWLFQWDGQ